MTMRKRWRKISMQTEGRVGMNEASATPSASIKTHSQTHN